MNLIVSTNQYVLESGPVKIILCDTVWLLIVMVIVNCNAFFFYL